MARKGPMEGPPENFPDLEEPCHICLLTKENNINRGPTTDVSKISPEFMLQMYFTFLNVEITRGFNSDFVAICSATSNPFEFSPRSKRPPLDILRFLVTTFRNQDKKVAFMQVDENV